MSLQCQTPVGEGPPLHSPLGGPPENAKAGGSTFLSHAAALALSPLQPEEIQTLLDSLPTLKPEDAEAVVADLDKMDAATSVERSSRSFLHFCAAMYEGFKEGPHHRFLEPLLHNVCSGDELRLTVSMAPRHGKSVTIAFLFVAWYLGHHPDHHIIMVTHTADLSAYFGRLVRNLIGTPAYRAIFPNTIVSRDKTAADDWTTTAGGVYLAVGVGGNVAGYGAHLLIVDDLVSEQAVLSNPDTAFDSAWNYMQVGPLQRLMPSGKIVQIGTRWGKRDPIGRSLSWAVDNPGSLPWNEVRFPAILPSGKSLWPEQWPVEQLLAKKAGMLPQYWAAQYMQEPTNAEGALLKREWWRVWSKPKPPACEYLLQVWDTAHETKTHNDYSACITWGVWFNEDEQRHSIIMLNATKGRWEFPRLKEIAREQYNDWDPDDLIIEKKAAGGPLIQELRQGGLIVAEVSPSRGRQGVSNDKRARMNAIAPVLQDGLVWIPDRRWAYEVVDECADFPNGDFDDYADCTEIALSRFRRGGFVSLKGDEKDEDEPRGPGYARRGSGRRVAYY